MKEILLILMIVTGWLNNSVVYAFPYILPSGSIHHANTRIQPDIVSDDLILRGEASNDLWRTALTTFSRTSCREISILNFDVSLFNIDQVYVAKMHLYVKADGAYFLDNTTAFAKFEKNGAGSEKAVEKASADIIQKTFGTLNAFCK